MVKRNQQPETEDVEVGQVVVDDQTNPPDAVTPPETTGDPEAAEAPDMGSKSSTEAMRETITERAKQPVTEVAPGTGLVDPTRDASGQVIEPDTEQLPDPVVFASGVVTQGPSGDPITGSFRREDPDFKTDAPSRIDAALKQAGMAQSGQAPVDPKAYRNQEAARVRLAAEAAKLDLTAPGGRYMVNGILVDCNGRRVED